MVFRIALTLALIGTVLLGGAYHRAASTNRALKRELSASRDLVFSRTQSLEQATTENKRLQSDLSAMDVDLGATKTRLTAAEAAKVQLGRELRTSREKLTATESKVMELNEAVQSLQTELTAANSKATSPARLAEYQMKIESLEQALAAARSNRIATQSAAKAPAAEDGLLLSTNRARTSSVMSVGPESAFVVVNYGAAHGALPTQIMSIRRGTETIATALISDVRENFSIAQVQPESLRGALHKGDSAVIAK
jgi:hypothetical protein